MFRHSKFRVPSSALLVPPLSLSALFKFLVTRLLLIANDRAGGQSPSAFGALRVFGAPYLSKGVNYRSNSSVFGDPSLANTVNECEQLKACARSRPLRILFVTPCLCASVVGVPWKTNPRAIRDPRSEIPDIRSKSPDFLWARNNKRPTVAPCLEKGC